MPMIIFETNKRGARVVVYTAGGGKWLDLVLRSVGSDALELRRNFNSGAPIDFLRTIKSLRDLRIVDWRLTDGPVLETLGHLQHLNLSTPKLKPINLTGLNRLLSLVVDFSCCLTHVPRIPGLRDLALGRYSRQTSAELADFRFLEMLELSEPSLSNLDALPPMIKVLALKAAYNVEDISGITQCQGLEEISLRSCPKIANLGHMENVRSLRKLILEDCGHIESISPLQELPALEELHIIGNTKIVDGQVAKIASFPVLKKLTLADRASYDGRFADIVQSVKRQ
jgi:Leucine-rich repeat (LRR) protein